MKAIILAAGEGKRLRPLTSRIPKCLLLYKEKTILERLICQLEKYGINEIILVVGYSKSQVVDRVKDIKSVTVVVNKDYQQDTNIYSMHLAVNEIADDKKEDVIVFESDIIAEDEFINYVTGSDFEHKSVWFTNGKFNRKQNGGILKTDGKGNVRDIKIVDQYYNEYENYYKLTGIMRIASSELAKFCDLLSIYATKSLHQYYLIPWLENLSELPSINGDASHYLFATFNTPEDYKKALSINFDNPSIKKDVYLIGIDKLHPIEQHNNDRISSIKHWILENGFWKRPLRIEKNFNLVLDGHHSLELAKQMNLRFVPVIGFDYSEVEMWSLREEILLTKELVIENAKKGNICPYKTVKHKFPNVPCECKVSLDDLI